MPRMKLNIVEKFYYEVEIDDVNDFEEAKEKFYDNQSKYMQGQKIVPDNSYGDIGDYAVEVYDREWCD